MKKTIGLIIVPVLALLASFAAMQLALTLQGSLENYRPDYAVTGAAAGNAGKAGKAGDTGNAGAVARPLVRRVVLVVVDGLRADTSLTMPFLNELRRQGAATTLTVGQPSFSKPGYTVLSTGAWQEVNGVTLNTHQGLTAADTVFREAKAAGVTTAAIADEWWGEVNGPVVTYPYYYADSASHDPRTDEEAYANTLRSLREDRAALTLVHFCQVDTQAHESGGARTRRYLAAAMHIDGFIRGIAGELDLSRDVLMVTADHGHLDKNNRGGSGHGGWEPEVVTVPLVIAGRGVPGGLALAPGRQVDVPATVSALLGLPAPAENQGRILWQAFPGVEARERASREMAVVNRFAGFAANYIQKVNGTAGVRMNGTDGVAGEGTGLPGLSGAKAVWAGAGRALAAGEYTAAFRQAGEAWSAFADAMAVARQHRIFRERLWRLPVLVVFLAVLIMLGRLIAGKRPRLFLTAVGIAYLGLDYLLYHWIFGNTFSLGVFPDSDLASFFRIFALPAYAALLVLSPGLFWYAGRSGGGVREWVPAAELFVVAPYLALSVIEALSYLAVGYRISWYIPDLRVAFFSMFSLMQMVFLGPVAVLLPLAAWLAGLTRKFAGGGRSFANRGE
ncbi:MAG: alkaline phosphatase family protein [Firmicutes bacterium]|nr:alkaline phosphatase family protein [Bacillota bacterium]